MEPAFFAVVTGAEAEPRRAVTEVRRAPEGRGEARRNAVDQDRRAAHQELLLGLYVAVLARGAIFHEISRQPDVDEVERHVEHLHALGRAVACRKSGGADPPSSA